MKNFKKILAAVLSAAMVVTLAPVGAATTVEAAATTAIKGTTMKLSASKATLNVGKSKTIKVTLSKKQTKNAVKVTVKSSKSSVAKVNKSSVSVKKNAKTASFKITAKAPGSATVTVTCKTKAKKTLKKTVKVTVKAVETNEDNVDVTDGKITLVDAWGLQKGTSDGFVGDTLRVNIPSSLGTMTSIIWYRDDNQIATSSAFGDGNTLNAPDTNIPGEYYAVSITAKGTTYKSNSIKLTDTESAAEITAFTIEDDYTDGTDIVYETADTKAIVTATLKKGYEGTFKLFKKTDTKFVDTTGTQYALTGIDTLGNAKKTNYDVIEPAVATSQKWRDAASGAVTVKFAATVTRGVEYVLTFDQKSIGTDTPGSGTANMFETSATAPYVKAPAKIVVDPVSDQNPVTVSFYDAEGAAMTWMNAAAGKAVSAIDVYNGTNNAVSKTDTKLDSVNVITKGVAKTTANASSASKWLKAYATTVAGVFAEKTATLESEAVAMNADIVTSATVGVLSTDVTAAEVTFNNLADAATVYLIKGTWDAATSTGKNATTRSADFSEDDPTTYDGKVDVTVGAKTASIPAMFSKVNGTLADTYVAIIIPKDKTKFGRFTTAQATLAQKLTKYVVATAAPITTGKAEVTNTGSNLADGNTVVELTALDQYGQPVAISAAEVAVMRKTNSVGTNAALTPWVEIQTDGELVAKGDNGAGTTWTSLGTTVGDAFTATLSTGQTLKITATNDGAATPAYDGWVVTIS